MNDEYIDGILLNREELLTKIAERDERLAEKDRKIERMVELMKGMYRDMCFSSNPEFIDEAWQHFKKQNNL